MLSYHRNSPMHVLTVQI